MRAVNTRATQLLTLFFLTSLLSSLSAMLAEAETQLPDLTTSFDMRHGSTPLLPGGNLSYGTTNLGEPVTKVIHVKNTGSRVLWTENWILPPDYSITRALPPVLGPAEENFFELTLNASMAGSTSGTVQFDHNGTDNRPSPFPFNVSANVVDPPGPSPLIRVMHGTVTEIPYNSTFSIGETTVNNPLSVSIRVYNDGDATMSITNVTVPSGYDIGDPLNANISPNSSDNFGLHLEATGTGTFTGLVRIYHNADNRPSPYKFTVTGTVTGGANPTGPIIRVTDGAGGTIPYNGSFSLGSTVQGTPVRKTLEVHNDGDQTLSPTAIILPTGFSLVDPLGSIQPGQSDTFDILLTAATPGSFSGALKINHNGVNENSPFLINITGEVDPVIVQIPLVRVTWNPGPVPFGSNIFLGSTEIGQSFTTTFTVHNDGAAPLQTSGLSVPNSFSIGNSLAATILPGESDDFGLVFNAPSQGSFGGTVLFQHNATNETTPFQFNVEAEVSVLNPPVATIRVEDASGQALPATSTLTFGPTVEGTPVFKDIRIVNTSQTAALEISGVTLPTGYHFGKQVSSSIPTGSSDYFRVFLSADEEGDFMGWIRILHNAVNEPSSYDLYATGTVLPPTTPPADAPRIDTISPRKIYSEGTGTLVLTGENFDGASVWIPESALDGVVPPLITSSIVSNGGTVLTVNVDATNTASEEVWTIAVQKGVNRAETDAIDFRVVPEGPVIDAFTPDSPVIGGVGAFTVAGANLLGATVTCDNPAVQIVDLDSREDEGMIGAILVNEGANPGTATLSINTPGGSTALEIELVEESFALSNVKYQQIRRSPFIYSQRANIQRIRSYAQSPDEKPKSSGGGGRDPEGGNDGEGNPPPPPPFDPIDILCLFNYERTVFSKRFFLNVNLLDEFGIRDADILLDLLPGEVRRFGVLTFTFAASLRVTISFDFCNRFNLGICAVGSVGAEIPFVGGFIETYVICADFPQLTPPQPTPGGPLGGYSLDNDCAQLSLVTSLNAGGEQFADIQLPQDCCPQEEAPIKLSMFGLAFPGTTLSTTYNIVQSPIASLDTTTTCAPNNEVLFSSSETNGNFVPAFEDTTGTQVAQSGEFRFLVGNGRQITVRFPAAATELFSAEISSRSGGVPAQPASGDFDAGGNFTFTPQATASTRPLLNGAHPPVGYDVKILDGFGNLVLEVPIVQDLYDRMRQEYIDAFLHHGATFNGNATGLINNAPPRDQIEVASSRTIGGPGPIANCGDWPSPNYFDPASGNGIIWDQGFEALFLAIRAAMAPSPVCLHSGHRSPSHNRRVPGSALASDHQWGEAVDVDRQLTQANPINYMVRLYRAAMDNAGGQVLLEDGGTALLPCRWDPPGVNHIFNNVDNNPNWAVVVMDTDGDDLPDEVQATFPMNTIPSGAVLTYDGGSPTANPDFTIIDTNNNGRIDIGEPLLLQHRGVQELRDYFQDASHVHAESN